ncbi:hypothetical protein D9M68_808910 [compost metagenome]
MRGKWSSGLPKRAKFSVQRCRRPWAGYVTTITSFASTQTTGETGTHYLLHVTFYGPPDFMKSLVTSETVTPPTSYMDQKNGGYGHEDSHPHAVQSNEIGLSTWEATP